MRPSAILFSFGCILLAAMWVMAQEAEKKLPIPNAEAQAEATKLIKEVYGEEYASAKSAEQMKALAKKLIQKASASKDDPTSQFVLLKIARDAATQATDGQIAFQAIDNMAESFQINPLEMKAVVLTALSKKARAAMEHESIAEHATKLLEQATASDEFDLARQSGDLLLAEARKARDPQLLRTARERIAQVQALTEAYKEVKAPLCQ